MAAGFRLYQRKLDLALQAVNAVHDYAHAVAERIRLAAALADDLPRVLAEGITIVGQAPERHQPFDEQIFQFDEQPILRDADHQPRELFAQALLHELHLLPLDEFAFGIGCAALGFAGRFANVVEFLFADWRRKVPRFARIDNFLRSLSFVTVNRGL